MASVRVSLDGVGAASKIHEREARDLVLGQVKRGQLPLDATPLSFRNDREIVLAAIAIDGAALEHAGLRLVESDRARAVRLLTWASQLSALGPAAAVRLVHRAPLVGPRLAGACWSGLQPESSYALGHAVLQAAAMTLTRTLTRTLNLTLTLT